MMRRLLETVHHDGSTGQSAGGGRSRAQRGDSPEIERFAEQARIYEKLLSSITDFAYTFDLDGRFTYVNKPLLDLWGLTLAEARGKDFFELKYPPELAAKLQAQIQQVITTRHRLVDETPYTNPAGGEGFYQYIFSPVLGADGQVEAVAGTTREYTNQKHLEREREKMTRAVEGERRKLASIIEEAPAFICTLRGPTHVFEMANEQYYAIVGQRDIIGKAVLDALPEVRGQGFVDLLDAVYQTGETFSGREVSLMLRRDTGGPLEERVVNFVYQAIREADATISGIFVHGVDVTDMVRTRESLRESENRFRQLADAMPQIVWAAQPDGTLDYYNRRWFKFIGVPAGDNDAARWDKYIHPEDLPRVYESWQEALRSGQPYNEEFRVRDAQGCYCWFLVRAIAVHDEARKIARWYGTCTDIEQRKRQEARDRFLLALDTEVRPLTDPAEITATHARLLAEYLDADRCAYADVEADQDTFNLVGDYNRGVPSIVGRYTFTDFGAQVLQLMRHDQPYVVEDVETHQPAVGDLAAYRATMIRAVICVPLHKKKRFVAAMAVHQKSPRKWTGHEVELVGQVASRCWESIERARVGLALRESEARFREMANSAPVHIWMDDADGRGIFANDPYLDYTGTTLKDLLRDSWPDVLHPDDRDEYSGLFRADFAARRDHRGMARLRRKDGAYRSFELVGRPRFEGARFVGYVGISQDVTERRRAEAATKLLADAGAAFSSSHNYHATLQNLAHLVVPAFADWCAIDLLDRASGEIRRMIVVHADSRKVDLAHELQRRYPPRKEDQGGVTHVLRSGQTVWAHDIPEDAIHQGAQDPDHAKILLGLQLRSYICVPLAVRGKPFGALTLVTSESGRVYTATDVAVAEELGRRAGVAADNAELLEAERAARAEAEEANRAKDKFLAVLSHELRTPLSPVVMTIPALEIDPDLPFKFREDLSMVRRNIDLEVKLIDDLLDLSRVTTGKLRLQMQPVRAHEVLRHALQNSIIDTAGKHLTLRQELAAGNDRLSADPARLQQVFWNLLRNAVKFTPEGGEILVRTSNGPDGQLRVQVRDTGVGIAPHILPRIFDAFEQGDSRVTRQFGGLGLGLAIAKAVVEMHGGRILAESPGHGRGSTFTVELATVTDAPTERAPAQNPGAAPHTPGRRPRVLLTEDHPDTARTMARLLSGSGFDVRTAGSVAAALELAAAEPFDVLVSDIGLPDGTGYELMEHIRARHAMKGIALSGYGMEEDVRRSREAGFSEHMIKPINVAQLELMLRRVLNAS